MIILSPYWVFVIKNVKLYPTRTHFYFHRVLLVCLRPPWVQKSQVFFASQLARTKAALQGTVNCRV